MIPCTEFIFTYSELFKFLDNLGGKGEVIRFWEHLSDTFLSNLKHKVEQKGIYGCWEYWTHTLNEEAADFTMELDEDADEFRIVMHHCPSMGLLLETEHIEPYESYCEYCEIIYQRLLAPLGYECHVDMSERKNAKCVFTVKRKSDTNGNVFTEEKHNAQKSKT